MAGKTRDTEYKLEILNDCTEPNQIRADLELYFVLDGELSVSEDQTQIILPKDGVLAVNPGQPRTVSADKNTLVSRITIPSGLLRRFVPRQAFLFWCNSTQGSREEIDQLRALLRQFLSAQIRHPEQPSPIAISYYYELLDCLCRCFLVEAGEQKENEGQDSERLGEIAAFLEDNYDQHISLNDLAEHLHLTYSYLSRYIKKALGINFLDYVTRVRLHHALEDLLYTNKPITHVAVDNGFVNSSAFNKAFKEAYGMTPTAYKEKMRGSQENERESGSGLEKLLQQAKRVLSEQETELQEKSFIRRTHIQADGARKESYHKYWEEMINIGSAADLLKAKVQEQVVFLKEKLGFHYVRFWNIFDDSMELREGHDTRYLNFDRVDEVLDFLVENNLLPFIELGDKPAIILRNLDQTIKLNEGQPIFRNILEFRSVLEQFFHHIVTRYRAENVRSWRFECWDDLRTNRQAEPVSYFDIFNTVCEIVKGILPEAVIGGCGMIIDDPVMESFLSAWKTQPYLPDFFSVMCYPYEQTIDSDGAPRYALSADTRFLVNQTARIHGCLSKLGLEIPLFVTEWNITLSSRNYINDSCYKACYLLKNVVGSLGQVDILGYWAGSDLISTFYDSHNIINGSPGLLSKDGIAKPAYYAYRFLHRMGRYLIASGKNYLITASGHFSYYIVCFNDQGLPTSYYQMQEDAHTPASLRGILDKLAPSHLSFCLENLPAEQYTIKASIVSPQYGSVLDEWLRLNTMTDIRKEDIDYLRRICTPHLFIQEKPTENGKLSFHVDLQPEELALIHIYQAQ